MGSRRPKQYLHLLNKPIIQHTLERLCLSRIAGIVVCLAEEDAYWETLTLPRPIIRVDGGAERCHSVLNGLQVLRQRAQPDDWVLVHDAARPCVRQADIEKLMTQLAFHPVGGLLAVPVRDTMKRATLNASNSHQGEIEIVETINREGLWHALTPQMFRLETLYNALQSVLSSGELVTDDAQAIERLGLRPVLIEGHADNIKVTHPQDLSLAKLYLRQLEL
jgi:2-C-methyl-D-erythritol 4-phosphate cytidylyltransferase